MVFKHKISLVFLMLIALAFCSQIVNGKAKNKTANNDTLLIQSLDTFLVGKQVFPLKTDSGNSKDFVDDTILLCFESDYYYYCFYNKKAGIDFLSNSYWNKKIPRYLDQVDNSNLNGLKFKRIDYTDGPFLTGFYNSKDSIIVLTAELRKRELKNLNELRVSYFSTNDTYSQGFISSRVKNIISELRIPSRFQQQAEYKVVLMEATSLVNNAWYNSYRECYSEFSNAIVLSMIGNEILRIQFLDSEYIDYLFKKKDVKTEYIHQ